MFKAIHPFPGITHITDAIGVCFSLVVGSKAAILFDTGYGTEDVRTYVATLTDRPVKVLLSHGHHDHVLGARWFDETFLCSEDKEEFQLRTGKEQRERVMEQAKDMGAEVPGDFLTAEICKPEPIRFNGKTGKFDSLDLELGGINVRVIRVPGHTPGSLTMFVPEYGLLLTGDDWNPCTWMWFPSSLSAKLWRENMKSLIKAIEKDDEAKISHVICSHQPMVRQGKELKEFLAYMTDERMTEAPPVDMVSEIDTHRVRKEPEGWELIFDMNKIL